jgi:chromosomal replication initiation ATPase DnaA
VSKIRVRDVVTATAIVTGVPRKQILGSRGNYQTIRARQIAMAMSRRLASTSFIEIGRHMRRDHSTVIYGRKEGERALTVEQAVAIADHARRLADQFWGSFRAE